MVIGSIPISPDISFKTFTDELLGTWHEAKRYPRKQKKKRMSKAKANSWARKAIINHEKEYQVLSNMHAAAFKLPIAEWAQKHAALLKGPRHQ